MASRRWEEVRIHVAMAEGEHHTRRAVGVTHCWKVKEMGDGPSRVPSMGGFAPPKAVRPSGFIPRCRWLIDKVSKCAGGRVRS